MASYKPVQVSKGEGGWGGPLVIRPTEKKRFVVSVTGGGIHPVAERIASLTGGEAVDGFKKKVEPEEMACVIIDCGGTARCGVYPKLGVLTVDITPASPSGPLMQYIKEDNFVSGVRLEDIRPMEEDEARSYEEAASAEEVPESAGEREAPSAQATASVPRNKIVQFIEAIGRGMGKVVGTFYQAGRETIDQVIRNILPFMAFVSTIIGIILYTGIGNLIAEVVSPLAGTLVGLLLISIVAALPFLSPLLGPGAVVAQVVGVLVGVEIGRGNIPPQMALPALFAINPQVGCDFVPVGLTLGEAKPETIEIGVPAVLFSRMITGPLAVLIAYLFSFGLYTN
jgi:PTS system glucitol/sorbitol-specific IIB component